MQTALERNAAAHPAYSQSLWHSGRPTANDSPVQSGRLCRIDHHLVLTATRVSMTAVRNLQSWSGDARSTHGGVRNPL